MSKPTKDKRWEAYGQALEEAADHLDGEWTDDPVERAEGKKVQARLRALIERRWQTRKQRTK